MTIKLYESARSPNARKVRLFAAELGIPLQSMKIDFAKGEMRTPQYLGLNPNGKIPTIDDDGFVLWESAAILKYLAAKRPDRGFLPTDPHERARLDQWMFWWTSHPEAALWALAAEKLVKPFLGAKGNDPGVIQSAEEDLNRFFPILDKQLSDRDYVLGELSLVDFLAAPWFESAERLGYSVSSPPLRYPHIATWLGRLQAKPYWKDA